MGLMSAHPLYAGIGSCTSLTQAATSDVKFMWATVLLCPENSVFVLTQYLWLLESLYTFSTVIPGALQEGYFIYVPCRARQSAVSHVDNLWLFVLTGN